MSPRHFGTLPSGQSVEAHVLTNVRGASVTILTYGAIVSTLCIPDRNGVPGDIVLGFDDLAPYANGNPYFGAMVGRIAGRVPDGRIKVDGCWYSLNRNEGHNHLHGGDRGLDKRVWQTAGVRKSPGRQSLELAVECTHGTEGYPGNLEVSVRYALTDACEFIVETTANTDAPSPVSLAHHSYFNLCGAGSGTIEGHVFQIHAKERALVDARMTPTGRREPVAGLFCDFTQPRRLGDVLQRLDAAHGDMYLLQPPGGERPPEPVPVAQVFEPKSGRVMNVATNEACLQFYTGSALDGTIRGKSEHPYLRHAGFCMECQGYPGAAGRPDFPCIIVRPGHPQRRQTIYSFTTD